MPLESRDAAGQESWEGRSQPLSGLSAEEEEALYEKFGDEVRRHVLELPTSFRMALFLCDVEELAYEEIAALLECPVGTVRSRISRARQQLREKLHEYARELGFVRGTSD
jgi:RNA polymerase sigma-70 factor (ECF subfamily)